MVENKKAGRYEANYSRYIASWRNVGGKYFDSGTFKDWLKYEGLTDEDIRNVVDMAIMGKFELERSAESFVAKEKEWIQNRKKIMLERKTGH